MKRNLNNKFCKREAFVPLFIFFILLLSFTATATNNLESKDIWSTYGNTETNTGAIGTAGLTTAVNFQEALVTSIAKGSNYQPIIADFNQDGKNEILTSSGTSLLIINTTSDNLPYIENELILNGSQITPMELINGTDGMLHIITFHGTTLYDIRYNTTINDLQIVKQINVTASNNMSLPASYIKCTSQLAVPACFYGDTDGAVIAYSLATQETQNNSIAGATYFVSGKPVSIKDADNDGKLEILFVTDADTDTFDGFSIYDQNDESIQLVVNDVCSADRVLSSIQDIIFYDKDGGTSEVFYACNSKDTGGAPNRFYTDIKSQVITGGGEVSYSTYNEQSFSQVTTIKMVIGDFTINKTGAEVCAMIGRSGNSFLRCADLASSTTIVDIANSDTMAYPISAADMDGDGYLDIISEDYIYSVQNGIIETFSTSANIAIPADLNNDGQAEIIGVSSGSLKLFYSNFSNTIPTLTNSFSRFTNPVCNGTTRFSAAEYDETGAQPSSTNFYNDLNLDTERLGVDCKNTGTITYGSYSQSTPYVECNYTIGLYYPTIYIQDLANPTDLTQSESVTIQSINGIQGSTCNVGLIDQSAIGGTTTLISNPVGNGMSETLDLITGGDSDTKMIIGFIILLVILVGVGVWAQNFMVSVMATIVGLILITALGLFPAWILIVFFLMIVFVAIAFLAMGSGGA